MMLQLSRFGFACTVHWLELSMPLQMGINTLKHALDVLENPDSPNRMEWAQWAVDLCPIYELIV